MADPDNEWPESAPDWLIVAVWPVTIAIVAFALWILCALLVIGAFTQ